MIPTIWHLTSLKCYLFKSGRNKVFKTMLTGSPSRAHLNFFYQIPLVPHPLFWSSPLTESLKQARVQNGVQIGPRKGLVGVPDERVQACTDPISFAMRWNLKSEILLGIGNLSPCWSVSGNILKSEDLARIGKIKTHWDLSLSQR